MSRVLISFIGTGQTAKSDEQDNVLLSKGNYKETRYKFNFETCSEQTSSIFGSALLKYFDSTNKKVDRWLILGTTESIWCDLIDIFDDEQREQILISNEKTNDTWSKLYNEAENYRKDKDRKYQSKVNQEDLNYWENVLTENLAKTNVVCRIVGTASRTDSQKVLFETLLNYINRKDDVIFDVTHGLRNQPIITSFALMYLRRLREIKNIEFYYGAIDLEGEVVKLDFCNEILEATEAMAVYENTGSFVLIGKRIGFDQDFDEAVEKQGFADEMNQTETATAENIKLKLADKDFSDLPLQKSLADELQKAVNWSEKEKLSQKLKDKSQRAFEKNQFFKAVAILWEAILVIGCEKLSIPKPETFVARQGDKSRDLKGAEERLKSEVLNSEQIERMNRLEKLRNAVIHGTPSNKDEINNAICDLPKFKLIFEDGNKLFNEINAK